MEAGRTHSYRPDLESLENRELLAAQVTATLSGGLLRVNGTGKHDTIVVRQIDDRISITDASIKVGNRFQLSVNADHVRRVEVRAFAGNDRVSVSSDRSAGLLKPISVWGGDGNDTLSGGNANDRLYGGDGNDRLAGRGGNDLLHGNNGNDRLQGGNGNDRLHGDAGNDQLHGDAGSDRLFGGTGNDHLRGGSANDRLDGGSGNNTLRGDAGNDLLISRSTGDRVEGGTGSDRARFTTASAPRSGNPNMGMIRGIEFFSHPTSPVRPTNPPSSPPLPAPVQSRFQPHIDRLVGMTNTHRFGQGLSGLVLDARLTEAAQTQADYMARSGQYSHSGAGGSQVSDRVRAEGYRFAWVAENIHLYEPTIARTFGIDRTYPMEQLADYFFDGWRVSEGHNRNMLASQAVHVGIAMAESASGQIYAVMVLGRA